MSGADGRAWYAGFGKCHNSPRAPFVLSSGCAARQDKGDGKAYAVRLFNVRGNACWQRKAVSQRSGGPSFAAGQTALDDLGPRAAFERPGRWS